MTVSERLDKGELVQVLADLDVGKITQEEFEKGMEIHRKSMKIVFSSQEESKNLHVEIKKILMTMGFPTAFVTDRTTIDDFQLTNKELADVFTKLGVKIENKDFIIDVAKKLRRESGS